MRAVCGLIVVSLASGACGNRAPADRAPPATTAAAGVESDTLRGTLLRVGADPAAQLVLAMGAERVPLVLSRSALLWSADASEVCLRIRRDGTRVIVLGYSLRSIGNVPASVDGVVDAAGDSVVLVDARGAAHRIPASADAPPSAGTRMARARDGSMLQLGIPSLALDSLAQSCDAAR